MADPRLIGLAQYAEMMRFPHRPRSFSQWRAICFFCQRELAATEALDSAHVAEAVYYRALDRGYFRGA